MVIETVKGSIRMDGSGRLSLEDMFAHYGNDDDLQSPIAWLKARGINSSLFAVPDVALSYAGHLSKMLYAQLQAYLGGGIEVAKCEANKDKNLRECVKHARKVFCDALAGCGVRDDVDVRRVTRLLYKGVLGASTSDLWREYGADKSLRDALPVRELMAVMMAENNASVQLLELGSNALPGVVDRVVIDAAKTVATMLDYQRSRRVV